MKPALALRTTQQLALTPQLRQSIQLLQLSTLELQQEVEQLLLDNPFLEREESDADATDLHAPPAALEAASAPDSFDAPEPPDASQPLDWAGEDSDIPTQDDGHDERGDDWGLGAHSGNGDADEASAIELAGSAETLTEHLHRQALSLHLGATDQAAMRFLIENLNDDGYLEEPLPELAQTLADGNAQAHEELVHRFTVALRLLHSLEPTGVGARSLAECLQLQLREQLDAERRAHGVDPDENSRQALLRTALSICAQPLDLLARRDWRALASVCGQGEARLREAAKLIARLEPRPGRRFVQVQRNFIVPDVIVRAVRSKAGRLDYEASLNPEVLPRLKVHDIYANALRGQRGGHPDLQQRLQEARWFIKNIQQRFDTILRVAQAIVARQKNFLTHGELAMRPLKLRDIAQALQMHESTISRVSTAKYMATPQGTYELKYFFGTGLDTDAGGNASSTAVRALIKQFVTAENPKKPLSDGKIADLLKEQGIECARRTVAKYREQLKIPVTTLRRVV